MNLIWIKERTLARLALLCEKRDILHTVSQGQPLGEASIDRVNHAGEELLKLIRYEMSKGKTVRYYKLLYRCHMHPVAVCALETCLTLQYSPELLKIVKVLGFPEITLELAMELEAAGRGEEPVIDFKLAEEVFSQISHVLCHEIGQMPFYRYPIWADERLMGYLMDSDTVDRQLSGIVSPYFWQEEPAPLLIGKEQAQIIAKALLPHADGRQNLLQLTGQDGSGRKTLLRYAAHEAQLSVLFVDYSLLEDRGSDRQDDLIWRIFRESFFYEMGICYYNLENDNQELTVSDRKAFLHQCVEPLLGTETVLCINTRPQTELISILKPFLFKVDLPALNRDDRIAVWEGCVRKYGLKMDCVSAAIKFKLTTQEICKAAQRLCAEGCIQADSADVARVCMEVLEPAAHGNIKLVKSGYTLEDLKLPAEQKQQLYNICAHVWQRHKVYDKWNMESKYAYGRNVSALFAGPPGTGKTMAVHVLSDMLELPLYRIDLSRIVDKYIGETEKRLEEVFDVAEKNNAILFFDEADSIFGKRSEVNDSKDRYANTEVSYILQRMEEYDGIVILATNYKKNIDEAFMRRIRYMVEFPFPSEDMRRQIWESSFADKVPLEDIDFAYLARQFEFSGGSIKNIVLNAVFLAASQNHPVNMKDILQSVRAENMKMGKTMLMQDFAEYGALFEG